MFPFREKQYRCYFMQQMPYVSGTEWLTTLANQYPEGNPEIFYQDACDFILQY